METVIENPKIAVFSKPNFGTIRVVNYKGVPFVSHRDLQKAVGGSSVSKNHYRLFHDDNAVCEHITVQEAGRGYSLIFLKIFSLK